MPSRLCWLSILKLKAGNIPTNLVLAQWMIACLCQHCKAKDEVHMQAQHVPVCMLAMEQQIAKKSLPVSPLP